MCHILWRDPLTLFLNFFNCWNFSDFENCLVKFIHISHNCIHLSGLYHLFTKILTKKSFFGHVSFRHFCVIWWACISSYILQGSWWKLTFCIMIKRKLVWACVAEIVLWSMQFCPRGKHLDLSDANVEKVRNSKRSSLLKKTLMKWLPFNTWWRFHVCTPILQWKARDNNRKNNNKIKNTKFVKWF